MMNKFFRMMALCALAGVPLLYTGCTDYSEDIDAVNSRIDALESGRIADVETQIGNLKTTLESLEKAKETTEAAINDLKGQLATLDGRVDDLDDKVDDLDGTVNSLQTKVTNLEGSLEAINSQIETINGQIENLQASVKTNGEGIKANADAIKENADSIKSILTQIGALSGRLGTVETDLGILQGKYDKDVKISEVLKKIEDAQAAADTAEVHATKALGDIKTLKAALGVYAEAGKLQEALDAKLDTAAFNGKFDDQLALALAEDGKITAAIDAAIKAATDEIYAVIKEFKATFNQELRSLVFIPELYVDGIEATEYTYMTYRPITENKNADGKGTDKVTANDGSPVSFEVKGKKAFTEGNVETFDPERKIYYHLNPLGAVVETGDLAFVSKDVEVITKSGEESVAQPQRIASSVDRENGILAVTMKAAGNKVVGKNEASIFALEAKVKRQDGKKDTTITSDYANLYATTLTPVAIAFSDDAKKAEGTACERIGGNRHLYETAAEALANCSGEEVVYNDDDFSIRELVQILVDVTSNSKKAAKCVVYDDWMKENEKYYDANAFQLEYRFELVDYLSGKNETSDSQFAKIDPDTGILTPCGVKLIEGTTEGVRDESKTGADATAAVGKRPLVLVTVLHQGKEVLAGYVRVHVVEKKDYDEAKTFSWPSVKFSGCNDEIMEATWGMVQNNVLNELKNMNVEHFRALYELQLNDDKTEALQYEYVNGAYVPVTDKNKIYGSVVENPDNVSGTTTDVFTWTLKAKDLNKIYSEETDKFKTIFVRYIYRTSNNTPSTEYEGIFVPLKVVVEKEVILTKGSKVSNYWFGAKDEYGELTVKVPKVENKVTDYVVDLDTYWEKSPVVATVNGNAYSPYKFYFAPVQPKIIVGNDAYQLSVDSKVVISKYETTVDPSQFTTIQITDNGKIAEYEEKYSLDYTKGIYTNTLLKCGTEVIAEIDQTTGEITYGNGSTAKLLLNAFPSLPRESADLFANIGVVAGNTCKAVEPIKADQVEPFYFLRPLNLDAVAGNTFTDGAGINEPEMRKVSVFAMLDFYDYRGIHFYSPASSKPYEQLNLFKYYEVNKITINTDDITTNMKVDGVEGILGETKLKDVTPAIYVKYDNKSGNVSKDIQITSDLSSGWGENQYKGLVEKFGELEYFRTDGNLFEAFTLRIPVTIGYAWGELTTEVDIVVNPTMGN